MKLTIDIGNTMSKLGTFDKNNLIEVKIFNSTNQNPESTKLITQQTNITSVIYSAVGKNSQNYDKVFPNAFVMELSHNTLLPITNNYTTPKSLGVDRIALAVGANFLYPNQNILAIDTGTCVTFDFIKKEGIYLGGGISPGLKMRFKALHNETEKLPLIKSPETIDKINLIGIDTESSILSGVINGLAHEIIGTIKSYASIYDNIAIVFTGGDSTYFQNTCSRLLDSKKNKIFADPYLTLRGLNVILDYNENQ